MSAASLRAQLDRLQGERSVLLNTPCAGCGHRFGDHSTQIGCLRPRSITSSLDGIGAFSGQVNCGCRDFTDTASTPPGGDE